MVKKNETDKVLRSQGDWTPADRCPSPRESEAPVEPQNDAGVFTVHPGDSSASKGRSRASKTAVRATVRAWERDQPLDRGVKQTLLDLAEAVDRARDGESAYDLARCAKLLLDALVSLGEPKEVTRDSFDDLLAQLSAGPVRHEP